MAAEAPSCDMMFDVAGVDEVGDSKFQVATTITQEDDEFRSGWLAVAIHARGLGNNDTRWHAVAMVGDDDVKR